MNPRVCGGAAGGPDAGKIAKAGGGETNIPKGNLKTDKPAALLCFISSPAFKAQAACKTKELGIIIETYH